MSMQPEVLHQTKQTLLIPLLSVLILDPCAGGVEITPFGV